MANKFQYADDEHLVEMLGDAQCVVSELRIAKASPQDIRQAVANVSAIRNEIEYRLRNPQARIEP